MSKDVQFCPILVQSGNFITTIDLSFQLAYPCTMTVGQKKSTIPVTLTQARWIQDRMFAAIQAAWEDLAAATTREHRNIAIDSIWKAGALWNLSCNQARIVRAGRTGRRKPGSPPHPATAKPGDNPAGQPADEQAQAPGWDPATGLPVG